MTILLLAVIAEGNLCSNKSFLITTQVTDISLSQGRRGWQQGGGRVKNRHGDGMQILLYPSVAPHSSLSRSPALIKWPQRKP